MKNTLHHCKIGLINLSATILTLKYVNSDIPYNTTSINYIFLALTIMLMPT